MEDLDRRIVDLLRADGRMSYTDLGKAMKQAYRRQGPALVFNDNGTNFPLVCGANNFAQSVRPSCGATSEWRVIKSRVKRRIHHMEHADFAGALSPCTSNSNRFAISASWMVPASHRTKCRPKP